MKSVAAAYTDDSADQKKPLIEHVKELQVRLTWSVGAVIIGSLIGYSLHEQLLDLIQRPLNQTLYFTAPTGGFSFVLKISISFGLVFATPILLYHSFRFLAPLIKSVQRRRLFGYIVGSILLALFGLTFAYYISLPAALHFLTQFGGEGIESLITADEYFTFALAYLAGFAVLFQLPLAVMFINRIKPLKPKNMMGAQRYIILGSFIVAAILTPTPDPINQTLMALPIIVLYQFSVGIVWFMNRSRRTRPAELGLAPELPDEIPATLLDDDSDIAVDKPRPPDTPTDKPVSPDQRHVSRTAPARRHDPFNARNQGLIGGRGEISRNNHSRRQP